jgi:hypothetical protein
MELPELLMLWYVGGWSTFIDVATIAGVGPTYATGDPPCGSISAVLATVVGLDRFVGPGTMAVDPDELEMFTMDTSSSDGGAEYPVVFVAICICRRRTLVVRYP